MNTEETKALASDTLRISESERIETNKLRARVAELEKEIALHKKWAAINDPGTPPPWIAPEDRRSGVE